jgi:hypothetical protein
MNVGLILFVLKVAVVAVTVLLAASLLALTKGWYRVHGRINLVFFALTLTAVLVLEFLARLLSPELFNEFIDRHGARDRLRVHLAFSVPSSLLLLAMLFTGLRHRRKVHIGLGIVFLILWTGTFVTGLFYLPHEL